MNIFSFHIPDWIFVAVNLAILVFALKKILWDKVVKVIEQRQEIVDKTVENAAAADAGLRDMEIRMKKFEEEHSRQTAIKMQDARRRAGAEYDRIVAEADEKARQIVTTAHTQAEKLHENAQSEVRGEIIAAVLEMTGALMEENMDNEHNERIIASYLERKDVSA